MPYHHCHSCPALHSAQQCLRISHGLAGGEVTEIGAALSRASATARDAPPVLAGVAVEALPGKVKALVPARVAMLPLMGVGGFNGSVGVPPPLPLEDMTRREQEKWRDGEKERREKNEGDDRRGERGEEWSGAEL